MLGLREQRRAAGMSLADLSRVSGLSRSYISKVENNRANATIDVLARLYAAVRGVGVAADSDISRVKLGEYNRAIEDAWRKVRLLEPQISYLIGRREDYMPWERFVFVANVLLAEMNDQPLEVGVLRRSDPATYRELPRLEAMQIVVLYPHRDDRRRRVIHIGPLGWLWHRTEMGTPEDLDLRPNANARFWLKVEAWAGSQFAQGDPGNIERTHGDKFNYLADRWADRFRSRVDSRLAETILEIPDVPVRAVLAATAENARRWQTRVNDPRQLREIVEAQLAATPMTSWIVEAAPHMRAMLSDMFRVRVEDFQQRVRIVETLFGRASTGGATASTTRGRGPRIPR